MAVPKFSWDRWAASFFINGIICPDGWIAPQSPPFRSPRDVPESGYHGFNKLLAAFSSAHITLTISGNHKPQVKDTSDGIWRRMQLAPWAVTIPESEVDLQLRGKLEAEAAGILNRLIEGLIDWRANGLIEPDAVRMATAAYRDQSDDPGRFLSATCLVGEDRLDRPCRVKVTVLFETFTEWAKETGAPEWTNKGFKSAMQEKGFEQKHSNGTWWVASSCGRAWMPRRSRRGTGRRRIKPRPQAAER